MTQEKQNRISTHIIDDIQEFAQYKDSWNTLAAECGANNTIYLAYDRISIWWRHFGSPNRLNIVLITRDGKTIGIFPLYRTEYKLGPAGFNCIEIIGAGAGSHIGLFRDRDTEEVIGAFFDYIRAATLRNNTIFKLDFVPDDSRYYKFYTQKKRDYAKKLVSKERTQTLGLYINLEQGWGEYYGSLTADWRRSVRYLFNRGNAVNRIKYRMFDNDSLNKGLDRLFELHIERWQSDNIKSLFSRPEYREYYKDIAAVFSKNHWLHFSYLTVDGHIGSLYFSIIYNNKYYGMIVARDIRYAEFGLGHIHHWYVIQEAFQRGLRELDFLSGDEAYKFHWAKQHRKYQNILITGNKPWGKLTISYYYVLLRAVQFLRNKHSLKEIISLVRLQVNNRKSVRKLAGNRRNSESKK